jgi:hypothetical protein
MSRQLTSQAAVFVSMAPRVMRTVCGYRPSGDGNNWYNLQSCRCRKSAHVHAFHREAVQQTRQALVWLSQMTRMRIGWLLQREWTIQRRQGMEAECHTGRSSRETTSAYCLQTGSGLIDTRLGSHLPAKLLRHYQGYRFIFYAPTFLLPGLLSVVHNLNSLMLHEYDFGLAL